MIRNRKRVRWSAAAAAAIVPFWLVCLAPAVSAQHSRGGASGGGGGRAVGGGQAAPQAPPRGGGNASGSGDPSSGGRPQSPQGGQNHGSQPRDGQPNAGQPVPGYGAPSHGRGYPGGAVVFAPWGFAAAGGSWSGYYAGYYDPWFDPWYGGYGYSPGGAFGYPVGTYDDGGSVHLKVKPREAEVYVDGYYAGLVDEFDGMFQRLNLAPGPHRIEIGLPTYEPLSFDVRIDPGQTVTYRGELRRQP